MTLPKTGEISRYNTPFLFPPQWGIESAPQKPVVNLMFFFLLRREKNEGFDVTLSFHNKLLKQCGDGFAENRRDDVFHTGDKAFTKAAGKTGAEIIQVIREGVTLIA